MSAAKKLPTQTSLLRAVPLRRVGRYEILDEIASGGMATVYVARSTGPRGFSRVVALKRLHPHLAAEPDFVRMFLDEARIASGIRHPNVVATLDIDDSEELSLVMEYVDGPSLLDVTVEASERGERVPTGVCVRVVLDMLAGLQAAHELVDEDGLPAGVVHRDVSPHNVLLDRAGAARITDFGIARASARLTHTRDGQVKGKLSYMAPEQVMGDDFDHRADVFATGVVAWELLSGRRLFTGTNDAQVLHALLYAPLPALDASVPAEVAAVVMRALERDPARRWSSCSAFADALEAAARQCAEVATSRAVAALTSRLDPRNAERGRASYLSLPRVDLDDCESRASGVVRRRSEAPECSYDEAVDGDDVTFDDDPELAELLSERDIVDVTEERARRDPLSERDETDFVLENLIIRRRPSWIDGRALWFCAAVAVVIGLLGAAIRATSEVPASPLVAPPRPAAPPAPRPVPLRGNTVGRRAAPAAPRAAAPRAAAPAVARPTVRPAVSTAWATVPLLGVGRDAAGRAVLR